MPLDAGVDLEAVLENIKTCDESARVITNDLKVTHIKYVWQRQPPVNLSDLRLSAQCSLCSKC